LFGLRVVWSVVTHQNERSASTLPMHTQIIKTNTHMYVMRETNCSA